MERISIKASGVVVWGIGDWGLGIWNVHEVQRVR
jgi:hypothetical protein